jgi:hypothetical protein
MPILGVVASSISGNLFTSFEALVVAGAGAGGSNCGGGGGGGQVIYNATFAKPSSSFTITIGAGGAYTGTYVSGNPGIASVMSSITAQPGTGGIVGFAQGGISGSGFAGGVTYRVSNSYLDGGGGGGDSQAGYRGYLSGSAAANAPGPRGGDGSAYSITGTSTYYGGGGNGGVEGQGTNGGWGPYLGYTPIVKSLGGGGWGAAQPTAPTAAAPTPGDVNTGGGGGGGGWDNSAPKAANQDFGASGGSGLVVIAYPSYLPNITSIAAGLTYTLDTSSRAGYKVYKFTAGTGSVTI